MKTTFFIVFITIVFSSCIKNNDYNEDTEDTNEIFISALLAQVSPTSRATDDGTNATWVTNDSLGLFCTQSNPAANNLKYTLAGSTWSTTAPIYWKDYTTSHQFYAYAPYASGNTVTAIKIPILNTQTGTINPTQNILYSNNQRNGITRTSNGNISLRFKHVLALIQLNIKTDGTVPSGTQLTSLTISGKTGENLTTTTTGATFSVKDSTYTANAATGTTITVQPTSTTTLSSTSTMINVLVYPTTPTTPTLSINCSFSDGSTGNASVTLDTSANYARSTKYTYTVTLSRNAITVSNVTIDPWLTGTTSTINPIL